MPPDDKERNVLRPWQCHTTQRIEATLRTDDNEYLITANYHDEGDGTHAHLRTITIGHFSDTRHDPMYIDLADASILAQTIEHLIKAHNSRLRTT
jgi:hypothetical protein